MFSTLKIFNKNMIILRDDLLGEINGNKARKLDIFKDLKLPYKHIISYGSSQSNAMQALALWTKNNNYNFSFVCARRCEISGNLKSALENNAVIYYANNPKEFAKTLHKNDNNSFLISEGVCEDYARFGFYKMAKEIAKIVNELDCDVVLASGTYTSAIYLEKYLSTLSNARVFTASCVNANEYFVKQINKLNPNSKLKLLKTARKYHFANLYEELFILNESINDIEFDLLYDSVCLKAIYENLDELKENILYIHQGGLIGSKNLELRYNKKYNLIN